MRSVYKFLLGIIFISVIFYACDKVDEPYINENVPWVPTGKKVLLEDFTGHKCVNCPGAAILAHELQDQYKDHLVVIAIHAGYFAQPSASGDYAYDFRTPTGDELDNFFGVSALGNPKGMVNRIGEGTAKVLNPDDWSGAIGESISQFPSIEINISNSYDTAQNKLESTIETEFLLDMEGTYNICAFIIEDSIVRAQKNNDPNIGPTLDWPDYVHMHVLRGSMNGTWGEKIGSGNIAANTIFENNYSIETGTTDWKAGHCSVVVFIYNEATKEVIQAEEKAFIE